MDPQIAQNRVGSTSSPPSCVGSSRLSYGSGVLGGLHGGRLDVEALGDLLDVLLLVDLDRLVLMIVVNLHAEEVGGLAEVRDGIALSHEPAIVVESPVGTHTDAVGAASNRPRHVGMDGVVPAPRPKLAVACLGWEKKVPSATVVGLAQCAPRTARCPLSRKMQT